MPFKKSIFTISIFTLLVLANCSLTKSSVNSGKDALNNASNNPQDTVSGPQISATRPVEIPTEYRSMLFNRFTDSQSRNSVVDTSKIIGSGTDFRNGELLIDSIFFHIEGDLRPESGGHEEIISYSTDQKGLSADYRRYNIIPDHLVHMDPFSLNNGQGHVKLQNVTPEEVPFPGALPKDYIKLTSNKGKLYFYGVSRQDSLYELRAFDPKTGKNLPYRLRIDLKLEKSIKSWWNYDQINTLKDKVVHPKEPGYHELQFFFATGHPPAGVTSVPTANYYVEYLKN